MLVSIIVPIYNVGGFVSRCLESLLRQSFTDWEAILVDDGSTDDSYAVCSAYAKRDARFRLVRQSNAGVSCARNSGLRVAKGCWVAFLDPDDYVEDDWLAHVSLLLPTSGLDLVLWGHSRISADGAMLGRVLPSHDGAVDLLAVVRRKSFRHVWSFLFLRSLIVSAEIYFPVGLRTSEDQAFLLKYFLYAKSCCAISRSFVNYVDRAGSVTSQTVDLQYATNNLIAASDVACFAVSRHTDVPQCVRLGIDRLFASFRIYCVLGSDGVFSEEMATVYSSYYDQVASSVPGCFSFKQRLAARHLRFVVWGDSLLQRYRRFMRSLRHARCL